MSQVTEIIDLLKQGLTPAEIKRQGYTHSLVSHASGAYKYAQRESSINSAIAADDDSTATRRRRGKLKSSGSDSIDKTPGMLMVGGRDAQAEALLLQSKAMRLPMPELLPMAMNAARREWNWDEDMTVTDFIDTILWHFFSAKGIFLGTYYKLQDMEQLIAEAKQSDGDGDLPLPEPEISEQEEDEWTLHRDVEHEDDKAPVIMDDVIFEPPAQVIATPAVVTDAEFSEQDADEFELELDEDSQQHDGDVVTIRDILMAKGG